MAKRPAPPKPRNPMAMLLTQLKGAGVHGKTRKAQRRADKVRLSQDHCSVAQR